MTTQTRPAWFDEFLDAERNERPPNLTAAQIAMSRALIVARIYDMLETGRARFKENHGRWPTENELEQFVLMEKITMTRLRLLNPPYRREVTVFPRPPEGRRPSTDFGNRTPEQRRAAVDAANAAKPRGVRVDFRCGHPAAICSGCSQVRDEIAKFLCDSGMAVAIPEPGNTSWPEQVRRATAQIEAAGAA